MKKVLTVVFVLGGIVLMGGGRSWALSPETSMLLDLLKAKGVITQGEAVEFAKTLEGKMAAIAPANDEHHHSVQSLSDRIERMEGKNEGLETLGGTLRVSGLIETEMTASRVKGAEGAITKNSDLVLATAQLNADAKVNQYMGGRLVALYEEGENDDTIVIDEAVVALKGGEGSPVYTNVGRQYLPFGRYESHFISDPGTLALGETNDTAVVAGYANDIVDCAIGGFKGKVKESGNSDRINSAVASVTLTMPKAREDGLALSGGVSYLSNLATSDSLEAETMDGEVVDSVGGGSAFLSLAYAERFFVEAEYLGAVKDFAVGDFSFIDVGNRRPAAWNLEVAARFAKATEFALRYGGSDGAGTFLPQDEYGAAVLYNIFASTNLVVEYLYQEFQGASDNSQGTVQLAVEF